MEQEFLEKLHPLTREAIKIIKFNGSAKPLKARINKTGEIRTWSSANQLLKNTNGIFKPLRNKVPNTTLKDFQEKLDKKFGIGLLKVMEYKSFTSPVKIKCSKCLGEKIYPSAAHFNQVQRGCPNCGEVMTKEDFQGEINNLFGEKEFEILSFTKSDEKITLKHKCGFIANKLNAAKIRNMSGCPICKRAKSLGRRDIAHFLLKREIPFQTKYEFPDLQGDKYPLRFDFSIPFSDRLLLIDYNDGYCTENDNKRKYEYCLAHSISLLYISYWENKNLQKLILNFLKFNDYPLGEYASSEAETLDTEM